MYRMGSLSYMANTKKGAFAPFLMLLFSSPKKRLFIRKLCHQRRNSKIGKNDDSQYNPVISEKLEIMLSDIAHQELDGVYGYAEGHCHTENQVEKLCSCKTAALDKKIFTIL